MADITRDDVVESRARALWTLERGDRPGTWKGATDFTHGRYREKAEATMQADAAQGLGLVPRLATEEMVNAYMRGRAVTGMASGINAANRAGNLLGDGK